MDRVNRRFASYNEKIKNFICNDTFQFSSGKKVIVNISSGVINNDRVTLELDKDIGIKNLKISGKWEYAELQCGGQKIERIYPEIRDTFTSTLNGFPPTYFHRRQLNIISPSPETLSISYEEIIDCYEYHHTVPIQRDFQIYQLVKDSFTFTNNKVQLYNYIYLPTTMIAVKIPHKCKRVFIASNYANSYDNPSDIIPLIYNKIKDIWILETRNNPFIYDSINLHIIPKSPTNKTFPIDLFVENINIAMEYSGMYGCRYAW